MTDHRAEGALGADLHAVLHDSFCGSDPESCLAPEFWIAAAVRLVARGITLDVGRLTAALNDAQIRPGDIALGHDLTPLAARIAAAYGTRHEHRAEYPSACTGCEHLAADLVARAPEWMRTR